MSAILTFAGPEIFAAFAKENRARFGEYSPRLDELIKSANLLAATCCGGIKGKRQEAVDIIYQAAIQEIKLDENFAKAIKDATASSMLRFEHKGVLIEEF